MVVQRQGFFSVPIDRSSNRRERSTDKPVNNDLHQVLVEEAFSKTPGLQTWEKGGCHSAFATSRHNM